MNDLEKLRPYNLAPHVGPTLDRRQFMQVAGGALAVGALGTSCAHRPATPEAVMTERNLVLAAIDEAQRAGADWAGARLSEHWFESIYTREERITRATQSSTRGIGIRALVGGSWGFSATRDLSEDAVRQAARAATETAAANNRIAPSNLTLAPVPAFPEAQWVTPHEIDPFTVPIEEKADLLFATNKAALEVDGAKYVSSGILSVKEDILLATTDGSVIAQTLIRISPSVTITAISSDGRDYQTRGSCVEPAGRGWEYVLGLDMPGNAPRWAEEAVRKLSATPVEPGQWDLVLHPSNLWLTIHESIGHPTELDRVLGYEANYAGTSFMAPPGQVLNKLRMGPEMMTIMGNRTEDGGCATSGWDDEGTPTEAWPMIENGVLVDYSTTRDLAGRISEYTGITKSHACAHGMDWSSMPFLRMPNVSLMPGKEPLSEDDVIAATDRGIYIEGRGSYSIDQQRYNMQFAGQVFWEIKNGKKHRMLRDVAYTSRTPEFWNSMALLGGPETYYLGASFYCAKGQPGQSRAVSHGCPITLFRDITILNTA